MNQMSQRWNHIRNQGNNKAPAAPCARRSSYRLARRSPYDAEGKNDGVSSDRHRTRLNTTAFVGTLEDGYIRKVPLPRVSP